MIFDCERTKRTDQPVLNFMGHTYRQGELALAFEHVCSKTDWKAPIKTTVPNEDILVTCAAIEFFTVTKAKVRLLTWSNAAEISSPGYRMGPAGDH